MAQKFEAHIISSDTTNVVSIWRRLSGADREHLSRWIKCGRPLGLLDAEIIDHRRGSDGGRVHVLVWVREAADAAYRLVPNGCGWTVMDNLRENELSRHDTFEAALDAIRPVFSYTGIMPRKRGSARIAQRSKSMLTAPGGRAAALRV